MGGLRNQTQAFNICSLKISKIIEVIDSANKNGRPLKITGYKSETDGVYDQTLVFGGRALYLALLRQCIQKYAAPEESRPDWCPEPEWEQAVSEQVASWKTSAENLENGDPSVRKPHRYTTQSATGAWLYDPGEPTEDNLPTTIAITQMLRVSRAQRTPTVARDPKSYKTMQSRAKDWLRSNSPLKDYVALLTLREDKLEDICVA